MPQLYYAGPSRQPHPVADDRVVAMLEIGTLTPISLVSEEGMTEWQPLHVVRPDLINTGLPSHPGVNSPLNAQAIDGTSRSHEIDFKIMGDDMQIVEIDLDPQETVIAEAGSMNYMEAGIQFETKTGDGSYPTAGFMDKLLSVGKRVMTGKSLFMRHFTNRVSIKQSVVFAAPYPEEIIPMGLTQFNGELVCHKYAFFCATFGTKEGIAFAKKLGAGFFGGEGIFLANVRGHRTVWLQSLPFARLGDRVFANARGTASNDSGFVLGGLGKLFSYR